MRRGLCGGVCSVCTMSVLTSNKRLKSTIRERLRIASERHEQTLSHAGDQGSCASQAQGRGFDPRLPLHCSHARSHHPDCVSSVAFTLYPRKLTDFLQGNSLTFIAHMGVNFHRRANALVSQNRSRHRRMHARFCQQAGTRVPHVVQTSHIEILDFRGMRLDELPARRDHIAHQHGECLIGALCILQRHLQDNAVFRVHCC